MNRQLYLVCLVCMAAMLVKSESILENGEEYEVKRFNVQGHRLSDDRSQSVVTRRKRATQPKLMYSDDVSNDAVEDKDNGDTNKGEGQQSMLFYSPPLENPSSDEEGDEEKEDKGSDMNEINKDKDDDDNNEESSTNKNQEIYEEDQDTNSTEEVEEATFAVIQLTQLPVFASYGELVAPTAPSSNGNKADANAIVVVQSHVPPKVNPQTHAVFELVHHVNREEDKDDELYTDEAQAEFNIEEEVTPVSTAAIWSTGADDSNDIYGDYNSKPLRVQEVAKKPKKPLKAKQKQKKKLSSKPKKYKNKYNNSHRGDVIKGNKKRRNNKRRPNNTGVRRPLNNRRRGPQKNNQNKKHHNFNSANRLIAKRHKNKKNADNKNVIYITIRKDPTPTVAPSSFWNIFPGHSAKSSPRASGNFGQR